MPSFFVEQGLPDKQEIPETVPRVKDLTKFWLTGQRPASEKSNDIQHVKSCVYEGASDAAELSVNTRSHRHGQRTTENHTAEAIVDARNLVQLLPNRSSKPASLGTLSSSPALCRASLRSQAKSMQSRTDALSTTSPLSRCVNVSLSSHPLVGVPLKQPGTSEDIVKLGRILDQGRAHQGRNLHTAGTHRGWVGIIAIVGFGQAHSHLAGQELCERKSPKAGKTLVMPRNHPLDSLKRIVTFKPFLLQSAASSSGPFDVSLLRARPGVSWCALMLAAARAPLARKGKMRNAGGSASHIAVIAVKSEAAHASNAPELLGVCMTPDMIAVGLAYFAHGALGLAALAKPYLMKDVLGLSPSEASLLLSMTYWPWVLKPVWGFIADAFPLLGSRRRSYLLFSGMISATGWFTLGSGLYGESVGAAMLFLTLGNLGMAFSDAVVDGLVVEKTRQDDSLMGNLQSYSWGCRSMGAIFSAYFSGALVESWGVNQVLAATAALPLLVALTTILLDEPSTQLKSRHSVTWEDLMSQATLVWKAIQTREILLPVTFMTAWQASPSSGSAMFYFFTNELHFTPELLGRSQLSGAIASLAGIILYSKFFASVPIKDYLLKVNITAVLVGLLPLLLVTRMNLSLGLPDQVFVIGDDVVQTVAGELAHMPILVLAARLCPAGVEATFFALLMSALNLSGLVASAVGAGLTDMLHVTESNFNNLFWLVLLCNMSALLPLLLLCRFVPGSFK